MRTVSLREADDEIIDPAKAAFDDFTGRQRDGHRESGAPEWARGRHRGRRRCLA